MVEYIDSDDEFKQLWARLLENNEINKTEVIFIYFCAEWCKPCQILKNRAIEYMTDLLNETTSCYVLDIDKCPYGKGWCNIHQIPSMVKFRNSKLMNNWNGEILNRMLNN